MPGPAGKTLVKRWRLLAAQTDGTRPTEPEPQADSGLQRLDLQPEPEPEPEPAGGEGSPRPGFARAGPREERHWRHLAGKQQPEPEPEL